MQKLTRLRDFSQKKNSNNISNFPISSRLVELYQLLSSKIVRWILRVCYHLHNKILFNQTGEPWINSRRRGAHSIPDNFSKSSRKIFQEKLKTFSWFYILYFFKYLGKQKHFKNESKHRNFINFAYYSSSILVFFCLTYHLLLSIFHVSFSWIVSKC